MESFEQKIMNMHEYGDRPVHFNDCIAVIREADAALAELRRTHDLTVGLLADYKIREKQLDGRIDRLTALNTAKGDLINLFETHFDTLNLWHRYQDDFKAVRARIRSLENE